MLRDAAERPLLSMRDSAGRPVQIFSPGFSQRGDEGCAERPKGAILLQLKASLWAPARDDIKRVS